MLNIKNVNINNVSYILILLYLECNNKNIFI